MHAVTSALPRPEWRDTLPDDYAWLRQRTAGALSCTELEWHLPWIDAIRQLKTMRGALVLAHNYQAPEIFHGIADVTGDSLALAEAARRSDAPIIVMCGVAFMAETAKVLAPDRTVLMPDLQAGCSLASSITAADVRELKRRHPGVPVVTYVNTTADVKAESDICCTSANALEVVESLGVERVIFIPDRHLGSHVAAKTAVELILWPGACEVHETFTPAQLRALRVEPEVKVIAHPECPEAVRREADFVGSTSAMGQWIAREHPHKVALITECSMADNLRNQFPDVQFVRPCSLCPHMKRIDLPAVYACLRDLSPAIAIAPDVIRGARRALDRMLEIGRRERV